MKFSMEKKGFSLVELMIVVAVVAVLIALAIPSYTHYVRKANRKKVLEGTEQKQQEKSSALEPTDEDVGDFLREVQELAARLRKPRK